MKSRPSVGAIPTTSRWYERKVEAEDFVTEHPSVYRNSWDTRAQKILYSRLIILCFELLRWLTLTRLRIIFRLLRNIVKEVSFAFDNQSLVASCSYCVQAAHLLVGSR